MPAEQGRSMLRPYKGIMNQVLAGTGCGLVLA